MSARRLASGRSGGPTSLRDLDRARRTWDTTAVTTEDPDELNRTWQAFKHAEAKAGLIARCIVHAWHGEAVPV
jgi:hypothetical protein